MMIELMLKAVATIRTVTLLLAVTLTVQAYATDITYTMPAGPFCSGSNAILNYNGTGNTFTGANVFTVQLSNAAGSFASPVNIGTLASTSITGQITITFPSGANGVGYRVRVISDNPSITSPDNSVNYTINTGTNVAPTISITAEPATTVGAGSPVYFSSSINNGGGDPAYEWTRNGNVVGTSNVYVLESPADGDEIVAKVTSNLACASPDFATSNTITVDVDPNLTMTNHSWGERVRQPDGMGGFIDRSDATGFSIGGSTSKVFVGTGRSTTNSYRNDFWAYDPTTETWTQKADLGKPAVPAGAAGRYNAVGFSVGGKGYVGTGLTSGGLVKDFYEYEPTGNTWITRLDVPGVGRELAFGFGIGSLGYVGGGVAGSVDYKEVYQFIPSTNNWVAAADFGGGKRVGAATFSIGAKGYVVGGYSTSSGAFFNDLWDFNGTVWTRKTNMPGGGRARATAFALAGNGYVGLGYSASEYDGRFYQYHVLSDTWIQKPAFIGPSTFTFGLGLSLGNRAFVYKDGKFFEYHLLTLTSFASKLCTTETIPVSFDASGFTFNANNVFTAVMSSSPSFAVATTLATSLSSASSGTINAFIPPTTGTGTYYFRLYSSNPQIYTLVETLNITSINSTHTISSPTGNAVCIGLPVVFNSSLDGSGFQWYKNGGTVGADNDSYTDNALVNGDLIKAVFTYESGCTEPVNVNSNTITMTVRDPVTPIITVNQPNTLMSSSAAQYQWYKNDQSITNANGQSYKMIETAVYKVKTTDSGGCEAFSEDIENAFTGLEDGEFLLQVSAYPSPFSNDMFFTLTDEIVSQGCDFSLLNELGQSVVNKQRAQKFNRLDLTGRAPGLYVLRLSFGQNTVVRRLLKVD